MQNDNYRKQKSLNVGIILFWMFCIIYTFFYLAIANYNQYYTDDLTFASNVNNLGLSAAIKDMYFHWEFNLNTILLLAGLDYFQDKNMVFANGSIFVLNIFSMYPLIKLLKKRYFNFVSSQFPALIAFFLICMLYASNRAEGGVIYWLTGQIAYSLPLSFLFLGLFFWLRSHKYDMIYACILLFLFAHTRFNYVASFISMYAAYIFILIKYKKPLFSKVHFPFVACLLGVATCFLVPGLYERMNFHNANSISSDKFTIISVLKGFIISIKHYFLTFMSNPYQVLLCVLAVCVGSIYKDQINISFSHARNIVLFSFITFIAVLIAHTFVIMVGLKTPIGYGRVFFFVDLCFIVFIIIIFSSLGTLIKGSPIVNGSILIVTILLITGLVMQKGIINLIAAKEYSIAQNTRIAFLIELKKKQHVNDVFVDALPDPGILGITDLDVKDTVSLALSYPNYSLRKYYQLPFDVYLKP